MFRVSAFSVVVALVAATTLATAAPDSAPAKKYSCGYADDYKCVSAHRHAKCDPATNGWVEFDCPAGTTCDISYWQHTRNSPCVTSKSDYTPPAKTEYYTPPAKTDYTPPKTDYKPAKTEHYTPPKTEYYTPAPSSYTPPKTYYTPAPSSYTPYSAPSKSDDYSYNARKGGDYDGDDDDDDDDNDYGSSGKYGKRDYGAAYLERRSAEPEPSYNNYYGYNRYGYNRYGYNRYGRGYLQRRSAEPSPSYNNHYGYSYDRYGYGNRYGRRYGYSYGY